MMFGDTAPACNLSSPQFLDVYLRDGLNLADGQSTAGEKLKPFSKLRDFGFLFCRISHFEGPAKTSKNTFPPIFRGLAFRPILWMAIILCRAGVWFGPTVEVPGACEAAVGRGGGDGGGGDLPIDMEIASPWRQSLALGGRSSRDDSFVASWPSKGRRVFSAEFWSVEQTANRRRLENGKEKLMSLMGMNNWWVWWETVERVWILFSCTSPNSRWGSGRQWRWEGLEGLYIHRLGPKILGQVFETGNPPSWDNSTSGSRFTGEKWIEDVWYTWMIWMKLDKSLFFLVNVWIFDRRSGLKKPPR